MAVPKLYVRNVTRNAAQTVEANLIIIIATHTDRGGVGSGTSGALFKYGMYYY
jgi:hypothetical protein